MKFKEVLDIDAYLSGFENDKVKIKGILNEKLNVKTKYWLGKFSDKIQKEKVTFGKLRDELIKKYGEEQEDGSFTVTEKIKEFNEEIHSLIDMEVEIETPKLDIESFDFESETDYSYLLKFIVS